MQKCNILLASSWDPALQIHASCFYETAQLLKYGFGDLGYEVSFSSELCDNSLNLILGYHLLKGKKIPSGYKCIIYQLEELTSEDFALRESEQTLYSDCVIWDFSERNIEYLAQKGINAIYKPLGFHEKMRTIRPKMKKDVDVLFYGSKNERRIKILKALDEKYNVKILFGVYGEERDSWIARSKIVLSIYYYEAKMFDDIRMSYLMNNKVFTIVEDSPFKKYEDFLPFVNYDEIVDACGYFLERGDLRSMIANKAYNKFSEYPETEFLEQAIQKAGF